MSILDFRILFRPAQTVIDLPITQLAGHFAEEKIEGIIRFGGVWAIPENAAKPTCTINMKPGRKPKNKSTRSTEEK